MLSIKENVGYTLEIKKSKFISLLFRINSLDDISMYLEKVKNTYKDATHYCYAYKLNNLKKASDDGEPGGTAGLPILEVLDKKNLDNILCIVVRYFGGIKLGAGGLLRAYSNSVKEVINIANIIELVDGYIIEITTSYDNKKDIEYLFKDNIIGAKYADNIIYKLNIKKNDLETIKKYNYKIIKESLIEK